MAANDEPLFLNLEEEYGAADLGLPYRDLIGQGVVGANDLKVTAVSATSKVQIASGAGWILGDDDPNGLQPCYRAKYATTQLTIAAGDPTNPRNDLIIARVYDSQFAGGLDEATLEVVQGTPAASPADPAVPNNAIVLARVLVHNGDTVSTQWVITDLRVRAGVGGGALALALVPGSASVVLEASTTTETDWIGTQGVGIRIPAGTLVNVGDECEITAFGYMSVASATSPTQVFKLYVGAASYASNAAAMPSAGSGVNQPVVLRIKLRYAGSNNVYVAATVVVSDPSGTAAASGIGPTSPAKPSLSYVMAPTNLTAGTFDPTKDQFIRFTHQWGTSAAANSVAMYTGKVERV